MIFELWCLFALLTIEKLNWLKNLKKLVNLKYKYSDITIKFFVLGIASESLWVFYSFSVLLLNSYFLLKSRDLHIILRKSKAGGTFFLNFNYSTYVLSNGTLAIIHSFEEITLLTFVLDSLHVAFFCNFLGLTLFIRCYENLRSLNRSTFIQKFGNQELDHFCMLEQRKFIKWRTNYLKLLHIYSFESSDIIPTFRKLQAFFWCGVFKYVVLFTIYRFHNPYCC